ncbi:hypothetical protein ABBQ38_011673 [Trebouxia sp. C0009 RCD-2024]
MKALLKFCCFSPPQTVDSEGSLHFKRLDGGNTVGSKNSYKAAVNPSCARRSWWCRKGQQASVPGDRFMQHANTSKKQHSHAAGDDCNVSSTLLQNQSPASNAQVQASSVAALPQAPPAGPNVSDPYEAVPFCSDLRWRKDRTHRKLSAGGTGTVYRAEKLTSQCDSSQPWSLSSGSSAAADATHVTHVAVKSMMLEQGGNAQLAEHEGRVLASLSDKEYVPTFHGYFTDPETQRWHRRAYIVTELLPGLNLDDFCYKVRKATGRLRTKEQLVEVRQWMWDFTMHAMYLLVQALSEVHEQRSHRDLKAGNVMVCAWDTPPLKVYLIDWANSRQHSEEELLNEYCTPEYSSPQLIAAITNLPAPVMDDAANDVWSLGVILFQMLACTVPGPQVPFEPDYRQLGGLVGADRLRGIQTSIQQQQADWALHNPAYRQQGNDTDVDTVSEAACSQPWQLATVQEAANFSDEKESAAERRRCVAELLSGMLHPDAGQRTTARQLATQQWLQVCGTKELDPCPATMQKVLQR